MRFLADENFPAASVRALRAEGHDVAAVGETASGADDSTVVQIAREQQRVLITFDRDFGVLVFGDGIAAPAGVVFLRFQPEGPEEPARVMLALVSDAVVNLIGMFTVVDREKIRQRTLPRASSDLADAE